jgi:putative sigma-54 modulation protein
MRIDVRFRGLEPSTEAREHVVRQVHFHLSRFGQEVRDISVRLVDVNGPKGGLDKRCRVRVRGPRYGEAAVEEEGSDLRAAIDAAMHRLSRLVGRELERSREARRSA